MLRPASVMGLRGADLPAGVIPDEAAGVLEAAVLVPVHVRVDEKVLDVAPLRPEPHRHVPDGVAAARAPRCSTVFMGHESGAKRACRQSRWKQFVPPERNFTGKNRTKLFPRKLGQKSRP